MLSIFKNKQDSQGSTTENSNTSNRDQPQIAPTDNMTMKSVDHESYHYQTLAFARLENSIFKVRNIVHDSSQNIDWAFLTILKEWALIHHPGIS